MKKTIMIVSTMLCIGLCVGGGITANAIEARYLACPDINCPGRMIDREEKVYPVFQKPEHCSEHSFCEIQRSYIRHDWVNQCNECGYIRTTWAVLTDYKESHSNDKTER